MSYILDALKKADRERELAEVSQLQSVYPVMLNTYRQYPWLLIGIIVTINIILLILLLWIKTPPVVPVEESKPIAQSESTESIHVSKINSTVQISSLQQQHSNQQFDDNTASLLKSSELSKQAQTIDNKAIKSTISNSTSPRQNTTNHLHSVNSPTLPAAQTSPPQLLDSSVENIPFLQKMSPSFQKSVPTLEINVHVYSSNPQQRFVLINGRRYTEGMHIREGGILENIRTNDIIVSYKQQHFRLKRP